MGTDGLPRRREAEDSQTAVIIGAAFEVHNTLGHGFLENVYLHALSLELALRGVEHRREVLVPVYYKDMQLACRYRADLVCFNSLLVECKSQSGLTEIEDAQVINYLRATELEKALILNFGRPKLQIRRLILTADYKKQQM